MPVDQQAAHDVAAEIADWLRAYPAWAGVLDPGEDVPEWFGQLAGHAVLLLGGAEIQYVTGHHATEKAALTVVTDVDVIVCAADLTARPVPEIGGQVIPRRTLRGLRMHTTGTVFAPGAWPGRITLALTYPTLAVDLPSPGAPRSAHAPVAGLLEGFIADLHAAEA